MKSSESPSKKEIYRYMNLLARAYAILNYCPVSINEIQTVLNFDEVCSSTKGKLKTIWNKAKMIKDFLNQLELKICELEKGDDSNRYIEAFAVCIWLDNILTYKSILNNGTNEYFSVHKLIPIWGRDEVVELESMNSNYELTGIQIIPKFEIAKLLKERGSQTAGRANPAANRDAFAGLNGIAQKVCFITWNEGVHIHNLIVPPRFLKNNTDTFNIAFCPLTDVDVVQKECFTDTECKPNQKKLKVTGLSNPDQLLERLKADWRNACINGKASLIFFPELLGTKAMEETVIGAKENKLIKQMALSLSKEGYLPPYFTVLPSYWRDGKNSATIVDRDGCIVGKQKKHFPYYDRQNHAKEALADSEDKHFYIIHIPTVHRIIILICSEFLDFCNGNKAPLFTEACCTLVLVPSYTHGEQDFRNSLQALKGFGTSVVWGNSCGISGRHTIGGCSVAGFDNPIFFSSVYECSGSCKGNESCVFIVSLPLRLLGAGDPGIEDISIRRI